MQALRTRTGAYADLPGSVYTKTAADGETLIIYGLNHGDTDDAGANLVSLNGYEKTSWLEPDSKTGILKIDDDLVNGLYINKPSTHAEHISKVTTCGHFDIFQDISKSTSTINDSLS